MSARSYAYVGQFHAEKLIQTSFLEVSLILSKYVFSVFVISLSTRGESRTVELHTIHQIREMVPKGRGTKL